MKGSRQKILIIDDTIANIQILNEIFHEEYQVFFATSGTIGLDVAQRERPDIVLLDVMMPDMDGYETCLRLKANPVTQSVPVIFVTALGEEEDETKGLEAGAIDYITKPISPPIVKARVRNHLELKQGRDLLEQVGRELAGKNVILEKERVLAHRMLEKILPESISLAGFGTAVFFRPSDEIGGDFFDAWLDGDRAHFLVGDISGHSISAALFMAVCKGLFLTIGRGKSDPAEIIAEANRTLVKMLSESGMYFTLIYLVYDRNSLLLKAASAGHNPAYIYRSSSIEPIEATGPPIGWDPDDSWTVSEYLLAPEDKILLYTDGLTEAKDAAGFCCGEEMFTELDASMNPKEMVEILFNAANSHCKGVFDDDLTIFALSVVSVPNGNGDMG